MVVGFNHNFRYRGGVYHVQTEDSGLRNPHIITLLYRGGTILASKKTSYADITKVDNLEGVVEDLMKEQHKEMLRRLKDGEFDDLIDGSRPVPASAGDGPSAVPAATPPAAVPAAPVGLPQTATAPRPAPPRAPAPPAAALPAMSPAPPPPAVPARNQREEKRPAMSLDDVILSYLVGDEL